MSSYVKKATKYTRTNILGEEPEEETLAEQVNELCTCSYKTRLYGFFTCICIGMFLALISFLSFGMALTQPGKWAVLYTCGNIVALASTAFLVGPMRQVKNMTKPTRGIAAAIYVVSMIATLVFALAFEKPIFILCVVCVVIQFCALWWYSLSYIPFARKIAKKMMGKAVSVV